MRAARFHARGDIRVEEVPDPQVGPGQVQVDVDWCGICGTDLHEYLEGPIFIPPPGSPHPITGETAPVVMGHEFAGVVSAVGSGVTGVTEGDRVAIEPYYVCGQCAAGRYNICRKLGFVGLAGQQGCSAEKCLVDARWVHLLGELPTDVGALVEPLAVGYHAVRLSGLQPGGTAAVFGAGPIGLVTLACLRAAGAATVVAVEPAAARSRRPRQRARTPCSTRPRRMCPMRSAFSPTAPAPTWPSSAQVSTRCRRRPSGRCVRAGRSSTSRSGATSRGWR